MAQWAGGGGSPRPLDGSPDELEVLSVSFMPGKRRFIYADDVLDNLPPADPLLYKRPRLREQVSRVDSPELPWAAMPASNNVFFIIKEGSSPREPDYDGCSHFTGSASPEPELQPGQLLDPEPEHFASAHFMERTHSGRSIASDPRSALPCDDFSYKEDLAAAQRVKEYMASVRRDTKCERILKSLIHPKSIKGADFPLDNEALSSIFHAANEIFFHGKLSQRVTWDWSHSSSSQYDSRIIGTTALRAAKRGGYETLIVLSSPILKDTQYNRRLLISTFLHELIHSYLFICCGFKARNCGGHTAGFKKIADMIDQWAGRGILHLCDMEADLEQFRSVERSPLIRNDDDYCPDGPSISFNGSWNRSGGNIGNNSNNNNNDRWGNITNELVPRIAAVAEHYTFANSRP